MAEGEQRKKNRNAKPTSAYNTQNGSRQNNEDNVQKIGRSPNKQEISRR